MSLEDMSFEQRDSLSLLMRELSDNPQTRKEVLRLTKQIKPDLVIPELEIENTTKSYVENLERKLMERDAKDRENDAVRDLEARRSRLMKKGLVQSEDDIPEVEKIMLEKGITNHEAAAEYWQWMKQSAAPTPSGYNPSAISKFNLGEYYKNPVAAARNEASKALNELRKNPKPIGL
jgi:hypothetical protein